MRKSSFLLRTFFLAVLLVWGLITKAHPGYDMFLSGQKIGTVKNKTQAEDIMDIIRSEVGAAELTPSLYLRFLKPAADMDAALLLENARRVSGVRIAAEEDVVPTALVPEETPPPLPPGTGTGEFQSPLAAFWVSSPFGERDGRMHEGVDMAADAGDAIYAADSGTVIFSGECEGYGNLMILDHQNGFTSYYAHCSALHVLPGDTPKIGDVIGAVGSTGLSTGPHLHFEIRKADAPLDPLSFLPDTFA